MEMRSVALSSTWVSFSIPYIFGYDTENGEATGSCVNGNKAIAEELLFDRLYKNLCITHVVLSLNLHNAYGYQDLLYRIFKIGVNKRKSIVSEEQSVG